MGQIKTIIMLNGIAGITLARDSIVPGCGLWNMLYSLSRGSVEIGKWCCKW